MKKYYEKLWLVLLMAVMGSLSVHAEHLTPEQALARATASTVRRAPALNGADRMQLVLALDSELKNSKSQGLKNSETASVYVFSSQSGFLVLAADDKVGDIVLGYSDEGAFDPTNMPPAMQALLAGYAEYIENFDSETGTLSSDSNAPQKAARKDIAPLVQTKWNQLSPYNDNCPTVGGSRCVTGCVATATAQVMKYHNWPDRGVGSYTHTFGTASGETVTTSADFGATAYDWAHMTNTYGSGSTAVEKAAVATLMHHCGVMSHMNYSPGESGTSDFLAGQGLLKYLKYDRGMRYLRKVWFTEEEWSAVFYEQMEAGQPIILGGNTSAGYHELVVDGYRASDGFFHFNWGWGGVSDGYFSIKSDGSFGAGQTVLCDVKPDAGSPLTVAMGMMYDVKTDKGDYTLDEDITFIGAICSYALDNITVDLGLRLTGDGVNQVIPVKSKQTITPSYGDGSFALKASSLSSLNPGEYDVEYVYSTDGGTTWLTPYYDKTLENGARARLLITPYYVMSYTYDEKEANLEAFTEGISPVDASDGNAIYAGHDYDFTFGVKTSAEWEGELACLLMDGSNKVIATSKSRKVTIKDDREKLTFRLTMPAAGTYSYALGYADGEGWEICSDVAQLRVHEALADDAFAQPAYILNVDRGYLPAAATNGAAKATTQGAAGRYALLQLPDDDGKDAEYYLYCIDNKRFIMTSNFDGKDPFLSRPDGTFTLQQIGTSGRYIIAAKKSGNYLQFGGSKQLLVGTWKTLDAGNQWTINDCGQFDATEVYRLLGWDIPATVIDGDINGDKTTDSSDVALLISYLIGGESDSIDLEAADVNKDGKIDVLDVTSLIDMILHE